MNVAFCSVDGNEWNATDLESVPPARLRALKRGLVCIGCGVSARLYRPEGTRPVHFLADHEPTCPALIRDKTVFRFLQ